jgi:hypothetical protein
MITRRAFSVAVYILNAKRILLLHHKRLGMWLPVGGELEAQVSVKPTTHSRLVTSYKPDVQLCLKAEGKKGERRIVDVEDFQGRVFRIEKIIAHDTCDGNGVLIHDFGGIGGDADWKLSQYVKGDDPIFKPFNTRSFDQSNSLGGGVKFDVARKLWLDLEFLEDTSFKALFVGRARR